MRFMLPLLLMLVACGPEPSIKEQYLGSWNDPTDDVMRTLKNNSITGCGEFYQKENASHRGEYLVACSRMPDGSGRAAWVGYLVWPNIDKVEGPDLTIFWNADGPPRDDPN